MKRGKILVVASIIVGLLLVAVAAVVMFRGLLQAAATRDERNATRDDLAAYYRKKPFPNRQNVELEAANLKTVRTWYERLLADLQSSNTPTNETSPIVFNSRREVMTAELVKSAPTGDKGAPVVAPDFTFGFARYKEGVLANPADVPRLIRQLRMVELLTKELYASGVLRIASVTREEFETVAGVAPVEEVVVNRRRRGGGGEEEGATAGASSSSGRVDGPVPMDRQRFSFEIVANEVSLVELLNRIARMDMFAVVTRVDVSKNGPDYVLAPSAEVAAPPGSLVAAVPAPAAAGGVKLPPPARTARLVSGRDREATLRVLLDVEVYSFEGEV